MNPLRLAVRFEASRPPADLQPAIPMFHRFIQRGLVEGLVLDVADYRHVPTGPGVMLVGHDVDYGVDETGFQVVRKRSADDDAASQLRDALRMGLGAIDAVAHDDTLDAEFDRARLTVSVKDRRLGSPDEVGQAMRQQLAPVLTELYGDDATVTAVPSDDPRQAPQLSVEADASAAARVLEQLGGAQAPGQSPWDISVEELAALRQSDADFVLLDVREETEYATVNLGGQLLPLAELGDRITEVDRDRRVVVHCRAGHRGAKATTQLREAGFEDAWNVNGGLMAWIDRVDPSLPRY